MQLVTFVQAGRECAGLCVPHGVLDLAQACKLAHIPGDFSSVLNIVRHGQTLLPALQQLSTQLHAVSTAIYSLDAVRLLAPIPRPVRNVFCVGRNYADHVKEGFGAPEQISQLPVAPQFFSKATHTVNAPEGDVYLHAKHTRRLDYEVELAIIIGQAGRDIAIEHAFNYVFGYTVANDVTARDLQRRHDQWFKGKSLDTTLPLGPAIVTRDEIPDPTVLELTLHINGEQRQHARVAEMIFDIPRIISELSAGLTLEAGDIIITGTPAGVGFAMNPPQYLKAGDVMTATISNIGTLRNTVVAN